MGCFIILFLFFFAELQARDFSSISRLSRPLLSSSLVRGPYLHSSLVRVFSTEATDITSPKPQKGNWRENWQFFNSVATLVSRVGGGVAALWLAKSANDFQSE